MSWKKVVTVEGKTANNIEYITQNVDSCGSFATFENNEFTPRDMITSEGSLGSSNGSFGSLDDISNGSLPASQNTHFFISREGLFSNDPSNGGHKVLRVGEISQIPMNGDIVVHETELYDADGFYALDTQANVFTENGQANHHHTIDGNTSKYVMMPNAPVINAEDIDLVYEATSGAKIYYSLPDNKVITSIDGTLTIEHGAGNTLVDIDGGTLECSGNIIAWNQTTEGTSFTGSEAGANIPRILAENVYIASDSLSGSIGTGSLESVALTIEGNFYPYHIGVGGTLYEDDTEITNDGDFSFLHTPNATNNISGDLKTAQSAHGPNTIEIYRGDGDAPNKIEQKLTLTGGEMGAVQDFSTHDGTVISTLKFEYSNGNGYVSKYPRYAVGDADTSVVEQGDDHTGHSAMSMDNQDKLMKTAIEINSNGVYIKL